MEDFGENLSPELREQEERLRQQIAQQQAKSVHDITRNKET
jgi:hypothetical protein